ncbi:cobalamin-binding protein [Marinobacter sp. CA1]|uniref:cobalamin-binding protein n=1 Tax=Marinobacter sp. CA1 TaxID=2817656 RepID=UPI001D0722D4|nr:cobalamin-binding protein [Marinobacter sp. CA1]
MSQCWAFERRGNPGRRRLHQRALLVLLMLVSSLVRAEICERDDRGQTLCLAQPAMRIATLSPGATELVFAAGAGDRVVAVVEFSDYPPEAKAITSVGNHGRIDLETLVALKPDLVIDWVSGNNAQKDKLDALDFPVFSIEPQTFEGVSTALERLGRLAGTAAAGQSAADDFRDGIADLARRYRDQPPVTVFYEVWEEPLMTVSDQQLIGKVITLCGGDNVFGDQDRLIPRIDVESVLAANPEAVLAGGMGEANDRWLEPWRQYPGLLATQRANLFFVPPSLVQRPTPRLLEGSRIFCDHLERARGRR